MIATDSITEGWFLSEVKRKSLALQYNYVLMQNVVGKAQSLMSSYINVVFIYRTCMHQNASMSTM